MSDRRPAPLLPAPLARLIAFALLATIGALEWGGMADDVTLVRELSWVLAGLASAGLVLSAERVPVRWQNLAANLAALAGFAIAFVVSGIELALLKPARWDELGEGIGRGVEALGAVRLPYVGSDPWPVDALGLGAALLCCLGAMLAVWPRGGGRSGYPGLSLLALLVLVGSPVVSVGEPRPLLLGVLVAGLTACFLWLERVPIRPGLGAVVLGLIACAVALPVGTAADREEPWFDYRAFAEGLGPVDPVRYSWDHDYGPIDWPREGVELFRVRAREPFYWKALTLDDFDGEAWLERTRVRDSITEDPAQDLPADWRRRPAWTTRVTISLRRLRTPTVVGAGTILGVEGAPGEIRPDLIPGRWLAIPDLRRGDSYTAQVHVPRPTPGRLAGATVGRDDRRASQLEVDVNFRPGALTDGPDMPIDPFTGRPREPEGAEVRFPPFEQDDLQPRAYYRTVDLEGTGDSALRASTLAGTWAIARRLREDSGSAYDYLLRVNALLRGPDFRYTETPPRPPAGVPALEHFLTESHAGYCQHFSGAMALLLRMGGVPARVVTGFSPGGFRKKRGDWIVRDTDAHSWVEAWFDGIGWVTFDPTPPATPARSQVSAIAPPEEADDPADATTGTATDAPLDPRLARQLRERERLAEDSGTAAAASGEPTPWWLFGAIAAALALLAGWALHRWRRHPRAAARVSSAVDEAVAELESALRRCGRPAPTATTLAQLELRLGTSRDGGAYLRTLRAARYGSSPRLPSGAERRAFRRDLAAGLGWRGNLLAWWALPPRLRSPREPR